MIMIEIPKYMAVRWMVYEDGEPLRGFASKREADTFARNDDELEVRQVPKTYQQYQFEEAPF